MAYDAATLQDDVDALQKKLDGTEDKTDDLTKALTDVAKGALDVAQTSLLQKAAGTATETEEEADEKEDMADDDDADDETEAFVKKLLAKSVNTEKMHKPRKTVGLKKALTSTEKDIDVSAYLQEELDLREAERTTLAQVVVAQKGLAKQVAVLSKALEQSQTALAHAQNVMAKGMLKLLDVAAEQDKIDRQPVTVSRFAAMEKSVRAAGGKDTPYDKDRAFKLLQMNKITDQQHRVWKNTGLLPASVDL